MELTWRWGTFFICWISTVWCYDFESITVHPQARSTAAGLHETATFVVTCTGLQRPTGNQALLWLQNDVPVAYYHNGIVNYTNGDRSVLPNRLNGDPAFNITFHESEFGGYFFALQKFVPKPDTVYDFSCCTKSADFLLPVRCDTSAGNSKSISVRTEAFYRVWVDGKNSFKVDCPPLQDYLHSEDLRSVIQKVTWLRESTEYAMWTADVTQRPVSPSDNFRLLFSADATHYSMSGRYVCVVELNISSSLILKNDTVWVIIKGKPTTPVNMTVVDGSIAANQVTLKWDQPVDPSGKPNVNTFNVEFMPDGPHVIWGTSIPMRLDVLGNTTEAVLRDLDPYTRYQVQVKAENEVGQTGPSNRVAFMTASEAPKNPIYLFWSSTSRSVTVSWSRDLQQLNIPISSFNVTWWTQDPTDDPSGVQSLTVDVPPMSLEKMFSAVLSDLQSSTQYCYWVVAINSVGNSEVGGCQQVLTDTQAPGPLELISARTETPIPSQPHHHAVTLVFRLPDCVKEHATHRALCLDSVLVTFEPTNMTSDHSSIQLVIPFSNVSREGNFSKIYVVLPNETEQESYAAYTVYLAGRLKSIVSQKYHVGSATRGRLIEVDYATTQAMPPREADGDNAPIIIITCVVTAVLLITATVILIICLMVRRKKKANILEETENEDFWIELNAPLLGDHHKPYEENEYETVAISDWAEHVGDRHKDSDLKFSTEYEEVCSGRSQGPFLSEQSELTENKPKNRFGNIVAYDHTRVLLKAKPGEPHSDYINANYIDSYDKVREFIATQGPLPDTVNDFWRMVWEQNTSVIIMLANVFEKYKKKCEQYWPEVSKGKGATTGGSGADVEREYGMILVKALGESQETAYWTKRKFVLRNLRVKKKHQVERIVYQYHYTDWPDHGVPSFTFPVLSFIRASMRLNPSNAGPVVVHCSAGVGRTGTFITLQSMMQQILQKQRVNVEMFVRHIRAQRNHMVQTEDQYIFIHDALLDFIEGGGVTEIQAHQLHTVAESLLVFDSNGQTQLEREYASLTKHTPKAYLYASAKKSINSGKNRSMDVIPVDTSCRVKLTAIPGREGSDYINASYLCGYYQNQDFIITQHPMKHTIKDFWRMVWDQNSMTVVLLSSLGEGDMAPFWEPLNEGADWGSETSFKLTFTAEDYSNLEYSVRDFTLESKDDYELKTRMFSITHWPESYENQKVFDFIKTVDRWHKDKRSNAGPLIVIDKVGGLTAGTFCALTALHHQLSCENLVDVYSLAHLYHKMRPGIWQDISSFSLLYNCITRLEGGEEERGVADGATLTRGTLPERPPQQQMSTFAKVRRVTSINRSPEHRPVIP